VYNLNYTSIPTTLGVQSGREITSGVTASGGNVFYLSTLGSGMIKAGRAYLDL
jgi:hypothetical protein